MVSHTASSVDRNTLSTSPSVSAKSSAHLSMVQSDSAGPSISTHFVRNKPGRSSQPVLAGGDMTNTQKLFEVRNCIFLSE